MASTRREFLIGCSATIAAFAGARLTHAGVLVPGAAASASAGDVLVVLFLRGGLDGLHLLAPVNDKDYISSRPAALRVTDAGEHEGLAIKGGPTADLDFRLHSNAAPLKELYDGGQLAFVHASGLTNGTRSHFEAMDLMERGLATANRGDDLSSINGWLTRHLSVLEGGAIVPAFSATGALPSSLLGSPRALASPSLHSLGLNGGSERAKLIREVYAAARDEAVSHVSASAFATLDMLDAVNMRLPRDEEQKIEPYEPAAGSEYPDGSLGEQLATVARMIKLGVGLRSVCVDFGGWDTHENQVDHFPRLLDELSRGLAAFYNDLSEHHGKVTIVVQSEFGRRLKSNRSRGTDHGHANVMMVLGGNVNGGKVYGKWPGLHSDQLDSRADLAVTTDYRHVLGEILSTRCGNPSPEKVFPGLTGGKAMGIVRG